MNTPTITATPEEAKEKLAAYKARSRRLSDPEYHDIILAYEWLAKGHKLIDVGVAIRDTGFDDKMRPKLALARADRREVRFEWGGNSDVALFDASARGRVRWTPQFMERVNFNRRHGLTNCSPWGGTSIEAFALVPLVPAEIRPGKLSDYHILWEVDEWHDHSQTAVASPDPYLLRRVKGDLFAIIAEWELTEIELMVCQGRALRR